MAMNSLLMHFRFVCSRFIGLPCATSRNQYKICFFTWPGMLSWYRIL